MFEPILRASFVVSSPVKTDDNPLDPRTVFGGHSNMLSLMLFFLLGVSMTIRHLGCQSWSRPADLASLDGSVDILLSACPAA